MVDSIAYMFFIDNTANVNINTRSNFSLSIVVVPPYWIGVVSSAFILSKNR